MKKPKQAAPSNTKIAVVFFAFLAFIVGISLIFKAIILIKNSQFDDSKRFTLSVSNGRSLEIMSLSPDSKNVSIFKFNSNINSGEAGRLLKIPIDGFISSDSLDLNQKIDSFFLKTIIDYSRLKTSLTVIDLVKLAMLARAIPENSLSQREIENVTGAEVESVVGRLVSDSLIEKDRQTIQIINGTGIGGLGSRLAKLLTNMGGNVIMVTTDNSLKKKSLISYIDQKTYTVNRLQKVLGYETQKESGNTISDITIVIGEDKVNSSPF